MPTTTTIKPSAVPIADKSAARKPLIVAIVTIVLLVGITLLLFFVNIKTAGQAIGIGKALSVGQGGIFLTDATEEVGKSFTIPIKANLGDKKSVAFKFSFTYDSSLTLNPQSDNGVFGPLSVSSLKSNLLPGNEGVGVIEEVISNDNTKTVTAEFSWFCADVKCSNALTGSDVTLATVSFTGVVAGSPSIKFNYFDVYDLATNQDLVTGDGSATPITIMEKKAAGCDKDHLSLCLLAPDCKTNDGYFNYLDLKCYSSCPEGSVTVDLGKFCSVPATECSDTDSPNMGSYVGGDSYYSNPSVKGVVTGTEINGEKKVVPDSCSNDGILVESYCSVFGQYKFVGRDSMNCPSGTSCQDGACVTKIVTPQKDPACVSVCENNKADCNYEDLPDCDINFNSCAAQCPIVTCATDEQCGTGKVCQKNVCIFESNACPTGQLYDKNTKSCVVVETPKLSETCVSVCENDQATCVYEDGSDCDLNYNSCVAACPAVTCSIDSQCGEGKLCQSGVCVIKPIIPPTPVECVSVCDNANAECVGLEGNNCAVDYNACLISCKKGDGLACVSNTECASDLCLNNVCKAQSCDATHPNLCTSQSTCSAAGLVWYNNACIISCPANTEPGLIDGVDGLKTCIKVTVNLCDLTHPDLCTDQPACSAASGLWYNTCVATCPADAKEGTATAADGSTYKTCILDAVGLDKCTKDNLAKCTTQETCNNAGLLWTAPNTCSACPTGTELDQATKVCASAAKKKIQIELLDTNKITVAKASKLKAKDKYTVKVTIAPETALPTDHLVLVSISYGSVVKTTFVDTKAAVTATGQEQVEFTHDVAPDFRGDLKVDVFVWKDWPSKTVPFDALIKEGGSETYAVE